ncbi:hypothetical protein NDA01_26410 [Trichocoleus desertorum AS-A10]|uniref:DUF7919 family protein n=1 Tax=Trichocoleus desertorum TaxID=1481672 RepID=UPI0032994CDE
MTCYPDLGTIDYFPVDSEVVLRAVGWLGNECEFPTGKVSQQFFNKLCDLVEKAWQPVVSAGFHVCELCQFQDAQATPRGTSNLFVPFDGVIYVAPGLIVHYVNAHHYLPPSVFIEAVMQCSQMQSMDYKKSLLKNGGRGLSKLAQL